MTLCLYSYLPFVCFLYCLNYFYSYRQQRLLIAKKWGSPIHGKPLFTY